MMHAGKLLEPFNRVKFLLIPKKNDASSIKQKLQINIAMLLLVQDLLSC